MIDDPFIQSACYFCCGGALKIVASTPNKINQITDGAPSFT